MNNFDLISTNVFPTYEVPCIPKEEEIWVQKMPQKGDHIRVQRMNGLYAHHGIYVSDEEVIHFTGKDDDSILDWSKPEVIQTDLAYFLKGGILEVKEYTDEEFADLYSPEQIVTYARACLGDKGYNLIFNNCEHFANVCTLGRFRSYSRVLMVHPVDHINDALVHVQDYIQTIGIAAPEDKAIDFANKATMAGVARCPLIGRMLNFEMPWDGLFLIDRLVRWNTLSGPLC